MPESAKKLIKTYCPRCGKKTATIIKTTTHFITDCKSCGFNMGNPRNVKSSKKTN